LRALLAAAAIALVGCGGHSDESANNHGYGSAFDAEGPAGLKLRKPGATAADAAELERHAAAIAKCAGEVDSIPPPPFVIFAAPGTLPEGFDGFYFAAPPLIVIDAPPAAAPLLVAALFEHEALHYVLERRGDLDAGHTSPLWKTCSFVFTGASG
jgi:hypothetical protein